jgi:RNA polymerase-interacting CarD/CdnL/TRCF family regulator
MATLLNTVYVVRFAHQKCIFKIPKMKIKALTIKVRRNQNEKEIQSSVPI